MLRVLEVKYLAKFKLFVHLSNGRRGVFSVEPYLQSDFFQRLRDENYLKQVKLFFIGIGWPEGQDFGPGTIDADLQPLPEDQLNALVENPI